MWYVVWTTTGSESKLCSWITEYVTDSCYDDCFYPRVEQAKKIHGKWKNILKTLFPGYLFVNSDSDRIKQFEEQLKRYDDFAVILSTDGNISPIAKEDTFYIDSAYSNGGILRGSTGYIREDKLCIVSGPLKGREGIIKRVDRHKRTALLEIVLFERVIRVSLGLEVLSKD